MKNQEIKPLKRGDMVYALSSNTSQNSQKRIAGKLYKVQAVQTCDECGNLLINLGETTKATAVTCQCGCLTSTYFKSWTSAKHFARESELSLVLDLALMKEDYDTAILVRDLKKNIM